MVKDQEGYHLLLVEDNLGDVLLIEEYLHEKILNLDLTVVNTFEEAREKLVDPDTYLDAIHPAISPLPDLQAPNLTYFKLKGACRRCKYFVF